MEEITNPTHAKSLLKNGAVDLNVKEKSLMVWSIKAHSHWIFPLDAGMGSFTAISTIIYIWVCFFMEKPIASGIDDVIIVAPLTFLFVWWSWRKKTVWNYIITSEGGHVEYWEDYFENTKYVFRGLAVFAVVCILTMVAIAPELIWMIAGVGVWSYWLQRSWRVGRIKSRRSISIGIGRNSYLLIEKDAWWC